MEHRLIIGSIFVALSWSISSITKKDILQHIKPVALLFYVSLIFFLSMLFIVMMKPDILDSEAHDMDYYRYLQIFVISILGFLAPNYILFSLVKTNDVNRVVALSYITPMITTILAWFVLHERINVYSIIGVSFIIIGAFIIVTKTSNTESI